MRADREETVVFHPSVEAPSQRSTGETWEAAALLSVTVLAQELWLADVNTNASREGNKPDIDTQSYIYSVSFSKDSIVEDTSFLFQVFSVSCCPFCFSWGQGSHAHVHFFLSGRKYCRREGHILRSLCISEPMRGLPWCSSKEVVL